MKVLALLVALGLTAAGCTVEGTGGTDSIGTQMPSSPRPTERQAGPTPDADPLPRRRPRGSEGWRLTRDTGRRIQAYTTAASGLPGTRVGLRVSTGAAGYRVHAYRLGGYRGGSGLRVWSSQTVPGRRQPAPVFAPHETRTIVARWTDDLTIDTTGWAPGFYVLKLRTGAGAETQVPYVVSSPSAHGRVVLVAPVTTWQAYNSFGGYSLYAGREGDRRAWAVSFDRPYEGVLGANDFRTAFVPVVLRAERLGIPLAYFANVDLHARPTRLTGARGYVSVGHDEYWTLAMRRAVTLARDAGTNVAFLGANTMYWRIRLSPNLRLQTGYRDSAALDPARDRRPAETTARFRDQPSARPENALVGMLYECYPVDTDYVVVSPRWWGFRGTGVRQGSRIHGLVGPESDRVYPDKATPRPLQVLSNSSFSCRGVTTTTQSVYYTVPSGAGVFTAGTLRWGCAMVDRCERPLGGRTARFVRTVTANLLRAFAGGPVGLRAPARDNVDRFNLPLVNSVDAS